MESVLETSRAGETVCLETLGQEEVYVFRRPRMISATAGVLRGRREGGMRSEKRAEPRGGSGISPKHRGESRRRHVAVAPVPSRKPRNSTSRGKAEEA